MNRIQIIKEIRELYEDGIDILEEYFRTNNQINGSILKLRDSLLEILISIQNDNGWVDSKTEFVLKYGIADYLDSNNLIDVNDLYCRQRLFYCAPYGNEECLSFTGDLTLIREAIKTAVEDYRKRRGL